MQANIQANVQEVYQDIRAAALRTGRDPQAVKLIAVTKYHSGEILRKLSAAGIVHAGENRWQVAREKFLHTEAGDFTWHFIGPLQTNKVKYIVPRFDWVHSVDRLEVAQALDVQAEKLGRTVNILLQVNVANEPQKHGFQVEQLKPVILDVLQLHHVKLRGLMTMAPRVHHPEETRPVFRALQTLLLELQNQFGDASFNQLSMGMSEDYRVAVEEGATMVRIGRKLTMAKGESLGGGKAT